MSSSRYLSVLLALAGLAVVVEAVPAQQAPLDDVVLLGERYGTRPPQAYFDLKARNPDAFTFSRAWKRRNPRLREAGIGADGRPIFRALAAEGGGEFDGAATLGPRDGPVTGTIRVPLVLGLFSDSPQTPPFATSEVQREFFDGPNTRYGTITEYYDEVSGGLLELLGETLDWERSTLTEEQVTGGVSALGSPGRIGEFIMELLARNDDLDWGLFDNDGPDGVPNSGDDDGYVDILAVMHPNFGAECGGSGRDDRIWSHKWDLRSAAGQSYATDVNSANGGKIRVNDYTVQPVRVCGGTAINDIGVLAHELGHGLGLPDLYDTRSSGDHQGAGGWDLMASGSWGCDQGAPSRPCHMGAWSKAQLGWVDVVTLAPDADLGSVTFEPVETGHTIYRVDVDGTSSAEYFLLENRQALGFDQRVFEPGLLVWHIDEEAVLTRWPSNRVNASDRMGVFLVQADGRNDLGIPGSNRGDAGDPFPGSAAKQAFHAETAPASVGWAAEPSGLTLTGIQLSGMDVTARVLTRFQRVRLEATGVGESGPAFAVNGVQVASPASIRAAPFQVLEIESVGGAEIEDGVRVGFQGWLDDPGLGRVRTLATPTEDVTLTAEYGGEEVRARFTLAGGAFGVEPGTVESMPSVPDENGELWFPRGETVTFQAVPTTGFAFDGWSGALGGMPNPATLVVDDPVELGASFEMTYGVGGASLAFEAALEQEIVLMAENAALPVTWISVGGRLPSGLSLQSSGRIVGAAMEAGTFSIDLRARDANGLEAVATFVLEVSEPVLGIDALGAPFILTDGSLSSLQTQYLDAFGNTNGVYDLGDFRAWVLAHPDLPATVEERALVRTLVPLVTFGSGGGR